MKLRLENGNFKIIGIATPGPIPKISFHKLPVGLDPTEFLGIIVEIRAVVPGLPVTYGEIGGIQCPAVADDTVYDDVIVLSGNLDMPLFYNKTTGDIGTDLEEISNKSESNDSEPETDPRTADPDGR